MDWDISYFSLLRQQVHTTEKNLDKKRSRPDDDGTSSFILAFLPSAEDAVTPPGNVTAPHAASPHSPCSEPAPGAMTIVEVDSDSDDDE